MLAIFAMLFLARLAPCQARLSDSDERSLNLVALLAAQPNLLSYEYLVAALGMPTRVSVLPGGLARQAEWFEYGTNHLRYRYQQEFGILVLNGEVRNRFELILMEGTRIDWHDLCKRLDSACQTHFNQRGLRTHEIKVSPNVTLEACQPDNYRALSEIEIAYVGRNLLAPPPLAEILSAGLIRRQDAFDQQARGCHARAAPLLCSYLHDFPDDAEAHVRLGDSYKACGCLHEAINQYRLAYVLAQSNPTIRDQAAQALERLHMGPVQPAPSQSNVAGNSALPAPGAAATTPTLPRSLASSASTIEPGF